LITASGQSSFGRFKIFHLSFYFATGTHRVADITFAATEENGKSTIGHESIVLWNKRFRSVAVSYFKSHPLMLGGPGKEVQIDETVIGRRKYNVVS